MSRPWMITLVVVASAPGCRDLFSDPFDDFELPDVRLDISGEVNVDPTRGKGVGAACDPSTPLPDCRFGLSCIDQVCRTRGDTLEGRPCILTAECGDGLHCSVVGLCQKAGDGDVGDGCATPADCRQGLVCQSFGFSGSCVEAGVGDLGATCVESVDCAAGLVCTGAGTCGAGSPAFGLTLWRGATCEPEDTTASPVVHFEVPGGPTAAPLVDDGDFFRLPFPNDVRMKGGFVDWSGFPTPGPGIVGFDPVQRIIDAAEKVQRGHSTVPAVIFRMNRVFDFASVWARGIANPPPGEPTLYFVNIDGDSPQFNWTPNFGYFMIDGSDTAYVCPRYVGVHPAWDTPLLPGTTYAVILAEGIKVTADGSAFGRDADFEAVMGETRPTNEALGAAWDAYAPLRSYLAHEDAVVPAARVVAAAVFTTQPVDDVLPKIREAIHAGPMPQPKQLTLCDGQAASPCDDGLTGDDHVRGCFDVSSDAWELHMKVPLPKVQQGSRPYLHPDDGGDLVIGAGGAVELQGTEDVCVSLTVPKNVTMPAGGWPVAIYGHGTGGSFRSAVRDAGLPLASVTPDDTPGGPAIGVAVIGWDGPMHGSRRGAELDPEGLFYNFANPLAARGNLYQGAADLFALTRAVKAWTIPAAQSPTGADIRFDSSRILTIGHSQGGTTGPLATPYEPDIRAIIWSGAGAGLVQSLLAKKSPVDAPRAVAVALQEIDLANGQPRQLGDMHPALTLVQGLFDPVDPLNHARFQLREPRAGMPLQHVLQSYGLGDSYTPPATNETLGKVLGLALAAPILKDIGGMIEVTPPVSANLTTPGGASTAVQVQAQPSGYDGHFVLFRDAGLNHQYRQWVATFVRDGVPTLVARP
ncbi:MAG: hypothetical protein IT385_01765 [Deltaproteobacteria bacterium]|nr:hypothetical protein [Deltaproteobacteria bacterium]